MVIRNIAMLASAVIVAALSNASAHGIVGGRGGPLPTSHSLRSPPLRFNNEPFALRIGFPDARFGFARREGWTGGAYSGGEAAYDDEGADPENMHFRVEEPFGPGDLEQPHSPPPGIGFGDGNGPQPPPPPERW